MEKLNDSLTKLETVGTSLKNLLHIGDPGKIFVTGGTGVVGYRTTKKLLQAGHDKVRFGCHYSSQKGGPKSNEGLVKELSDLGGEYVDFRWSQDSTYAAALDGVQTVFTTGNVVVAKYF
jgi:nucleoside-diphosphate-sugar epimerase